MSAARRAAESPCMYSRRIASATVASFSINGWVLRRQVKVVGARVVGVITPLDPPRAHEPVDMAADGDLLNLHRVREIALRATRPARQVQQDQPLGAGDAKGAHAPVELRPRQTADVAENEAEALLKQGTGAGHDEGEVFW